MPVPPSQWGKINSEVEFIFISTVKPRTRPVFSGSTQFGALFLGSNGSDWASGSKNGSNRVGLTSKRVQIRVQPYNVLNKPETLKRVGSGPQGPKSG